MKSFVISQAICPPIVVTHVATGRVQVSKNDDIWYTELLDDVVIYIGELVDFLRGFSRRSVYGNKDKIPDIWNATKFRAFSSEQHL